jgi:hypothetical protein
VRIRHARDFTMFCAGWGVFGWLLFVGLRVLRPRPVPFMAGLTWWTPLESLGIACFYAVAAHGIERRDSRAGLLALTLYGWRLLNIAPARHLFRVGVLVNLAISVIGITLVLRAAGPLRLRLSRPVV